MKKKKLVVTVNVPDSEPSDEKLVKEASEKLNKAIGVNDAILFVDSVEVQK